MLSQLQSRDRSVHILVQYRRSPCIVAHWDSDLFRLTNLATDLTYCAGPDAIEVLNCCEDWSSDGEIARALPHLDAGIVEREIRALTDATMLQSSDQPEPERETSLQDWGEWFPAAAHFHLATRNMHVWDAEQSSTPVVVAREQPPAVKTYVGVPSVELPPFPTSGGLADVLRARRTWRRFGTAGISLQKLSLLCGLTWGVQSWAVSRSVRPQALKTSPSGGARHSIEAYVCARDVEGLPVGIYHYGPDTHALTLVRDGLSSQDVTGFMAGQRHFSETPLIVFMTSVFARVQWRYWHARSYRNVYIEAGHLAQTFCLLATELNLAPFCTAALSADAVEPALGVDGIREAVLYSVGAGARPAGIAWAPSWEGARIPELVDPAYVTRWQDERAIT
jgi:SagB-type dehydrogenase family enzyme